MLNNLSIGKKLALVALVPFLLFLAFALPTIMGARSDASVAADTQRSATVSAETGTLFEAVRNEAVVNQLGEAQAGFDRSTAVEGTDEAITIWLAALGEDLAVTDDSQLANYVADMAAHRAQTNGSGAQAAFAADMALIRMIEIFDGRLALTSSSAALSNAADLTTVSSDAAKLQILGTMAALDDVVPAQLPSALGAARGAADAYELRNATAIDPPTDLYTSIFSEFESATPGESLATSHEDWVTASNNRSAQLREARSAEVALASMVAADEQNAASGSVRNWGIGVFLALLGGFGLAFLITASIKKSLAELRDEASHVANSDLPRLTDALSSGVPVPQLGADREALDLGDNEFGEVAASLNAVRESAAAIGERVSVLQGGIADTFVNLARRNQSLVDRQLEAIDTLEAEERDSDRLALMYRVDHLATRMRRNAESLLVLADAKTPERHSPAVELREVLRVAIGEVEDYRRIIPISLDDLHVAGHKAQDLAHLLAELMENAAQHSPPGTAVDVSGAVDSTSGAYNVHILDHGTGVDGAQLAKLNELLQREPTSTMTISHSIGLQVVSRLAHSLGILVVLNHVEDGGLTALVTIPAQVVSDWAQTAPAGARTIPVAAPAAAVPVAPQPDLAPVMPTPEPEIAAAAPISVPDTAPAVEIHDVTTEVEPPAIPTFDQTEPVVETVPDTSGDADGIDMDGMVQMPAPAPIPTIDMPDLDLPSFGNADLAEPVEVFAEEPESFTADPFTAEPFTPEPVAEVFAPEPAPAPEPFIPEPVAEVFAPEPAPAPEPFIPEPVAEVFPEPAAEVFAPAPAPEPFIPEPVAEVFAPAPAPEPFIPEPVAEVFAPEPAPAPEPFTQEPAFASAAPAPMPAAPPAPIAETAPAVTDGGLTKRTRSTVHVPPVDLEADRTAPSQRTPDQVKNMLSRYKTGLERGRGSAGTDGE